MSRTACGLLVVCSLVVISALTVTGTRAATLTITLDAGTVPASVVNGGDPWNEAGITMYFVPTTIDDCTDGSCFFGLGGLDPNGVDLYPARLYVDLSGVPGQFESAEVDVIDYCGKYCTRAILYDGPLYVGGESNTTVGVLETLSATAGGDPVDYLAVSSCEGVVLEIRIQYQVPVPVEASTWGGIKALFGD